MGRLNQLPFREIKRRLEAAGFAEHSQKGSHVKFVRWRDPAVDTVIVPKKSEIPVGKLCSVLGQAHIIQTTGSVSADTHRCRKTARHRAGLLAEMVISSRQVRLPESGAIHMSV